MEKIEQRLTAPDYMSIIQSKAKYVDSNFEANETNLVHPALAAKYGSLAQHKWKHALEIFKTSSYEIFEGIDISDIRQGTLNDCYLLCSIAAVAEFPERIADLFITKKANESGCNVLYVYVNGKRTIITVDEYFPCLPDRDPPVPSFVNPAGNEMWTMLIEKAWAKVNGSFSSIEFGQASEGLHFLTGAPCTLIVHKDVKSIEELWKRLDISDRKNYIMTAGCGGDIPEETVESWGLHKDHAYTLIGVNEVTYNGSQVRLVKLRNPWGKGEWKGDWSDSWTGWTKELKAELNVQEVDDGVFYMSYKEFLTYYKYSTICKWKESYQSNTLTLTNKTKSCIFFDATDDTDGYIGVLPIPERMVKCDFPGYKEPQIRFTIGKIEGNTIRYIGSRNVTSNKKHLKLHLNPGRYVIYILASFLDENIKTFNLHSYTLNPLNFYDANGADEGLAEIYRGLSIANRSKYQAIDPTNGLFSYIDNNEYGAGVIYIKNTSDKIQYEINMELTFNGLKMIYPTEDSTTFKMLLNPGDDAIALTTRTTDGATSSSYDFPVYKMKTVEKAASPTPNATLEKILEFAKGILSGPELLQDVKEGEAEKPPMCPQNHKMKFSFKPFLNEANFECFKCKASGTSGTGRWSCRACKHDLCNTCAAPPQLMCQNGHAMEHTYILEGFGNYACAYCENFRQCKEGLLVCKACQFMVCHNCVRLLYLHVPPPVSKKFTEKSSEITCCANNHPLSFSFLATPDMKYKCSRCSGEKEASTGRWLCFTCNYNICPDCIPSPKPIENAPVGYHFCDKSHPLKFFTNPPSGSGYSCITCGYRRCSLGGIRWCTKCKFARCQRCVAFDPANKNFDKKGHPLIKMFTNEENEILFRCDKCSVSKSSREYHYNCAICNVYICEKCSTAPA